MVNECYIVQAFSENFTGLELEDGGGRGTSGCHSLVYYIRLTPFFAFFCMGHQLVLA